MAMERARLGHLVADAVGLGSGVLGRLIAGLFALPPVQRAIASDQIRSRFVRRVLGMVRDPTG
jgi:hypothetical protein